MTGMLFDFFYNYLEGFRQCCLPKQRVSIERDSFEYCRGVTGVQLCKEGYRYG